MTMIAAEPIALHDSFGRVHRVVPGTTQLTEPIAVTAHPDELSGANPESLRSLLALRAGLPLMINVEHEIVGDVVGGRLILDVTGDVRPYLDD